MLKTTIRDRLMHYTNPMRIRAWFDFTVMPHIERLWRWIFKVKK